MGRQMKKRVEKGNTIRAGATKKAERKTSCLHSRKAHYEIYCGFACSRCSCITPRT